MMPMGLPGMGPAATPAIPGMSPPPAAQKPFTPPKMPKMKIGGATKPKGLKGLRPKGGKAPRAGRGGGRGKK